MSYFQFIQIRLLQKTTNRFLSKAEKSSHSTILIFSSKFWTCDLQLTNFNENILCIFEIVLCWKSKWIYILLTLDVIFTKQIIKLLCYLVFLTKKTTNWLYYNKLNSIVCMKKIKISFNKRKQIKFQWIIRNILQFNAIFILTRSKV